MTCAGGIARCQQGWKVLLLPLLLKKQRGRLSSSSSRSSSSSSALSTTAVIPNLIRSLYPDSKIKVEGDYPYGLRRYLLVQDRPIQVIATTKDKEEETDGGPLILASLTAHRNVVFGAKANVDDQPLSTLCEPLLIKALDDCYSNGEQPQALSALHGLTGYVRRCLGGQHESIALQTIRNNKTGDNNDAVMYDAVRAIATGIPRRGHTVVGQGTHRDAGDGWADLAREFIQQDLCDECILYQKQGGAMVDIELLADTRADYLASAGGAMARFFFVG